MRIWIWSISLPWLLFLNASPQVEAVSPIPPEISQEQGAVYAVKLWGRLWYALPQGNGKVVQASPKAPVDAAVQQTAQDFVLPALDILPGYRAFFFQEAAFSPLPLQKGMLRGHETRAGPFAC